MAEDSVWQLLTVFVVGLSGIWKSVPLGLALQIHPVWTALLTAVSSIVTVSVIYLFGEKVKAWIRAHLKKENIEKRKGKFLNLLHRYGMIGLGLLGSGMIGPIMAIILGLLFVPDTKRFLYFTIVGIILWSIGLTAAAYLGFSAVVYLLDVMN
jgi:membrane protein YqaA with SNARE-associated domain